MTSFGLPAPLAAGGAPREMSAVPIFFKMDRTVDPLTPVNTLTEVLEKDRKILGRLCQAVGRWESEEKEGKGPWAFHTRGVSGIHEAQVQAQGEAR